MEKSVCTHVNEITTYLILHRIVTTSSNSRTHSNANVRLVHSASEAKTTAILYMQRTKINAGRAVIAIVVYLVQQWIKVTLQPDTINRTFKFKHASIQTHILFIQSAPRSAQHRSIHSTGVNKHRMVIAVAVYLHTKIAHECNVDKFTSSYVTKHQYLTATNSSTHASLQTYGLFVHGQHDTRSIHSTNGDRRR